MTRLNCLQDEPIEDGAILCSSERVVKSVAGQEAGYQPPSTPAGRDLFLQQL